VQEFFRSRSGEERETARGLDGQPKKPVDRGSKLTAVPAVRSGTENENKPRKSASSVKLSELAARSEERFATDLRGREDLITA